MKDLLPVLLLFSIAVSPANAQEGQHPRPDLIPGIDSVSFTLRTDTSLENVSETLRQQARRLRQAEQVRSIGKREGDVEEMFGEIADIEVGANGSIYVLDERYSEIRQYGSDDLPIRAMGRPGQGPKEFKAPTGLALINDTLLAVLDPQRVALKIFRRTENGLQHRRTVRHGMPRSHMCSLGDRIVLQAVRPPRSQDSETEQVAEERPLLHLYDRDGTLRRSFGEAYRSEDTVLSLQLSGGPVGCAEEKELLVTALPGTSMLYGYRASGSRAWVSRIEDYTPILVQKEGRTTHFGSGGNQAEDVTRRITPLSTGEVLVQVAHRTPATLSGPRPWAHVATYLVAPETGGGVYVGDELPPIMDVHGTRLYGAVSFPYPRVEVYEFGQSESQ